MLPCFELESPHRRSRRCASRESRTKWRGSWCCSRRAAQLWSVGRTAPCPASSSPPACGAAMFGARSASSAAVAATSAAWSGQRVSRRVHLVGVDHGSSRGAAGRSWRRKLNPALILDLNSAYSAYSSVQRERSCGRSATTWRHSRQTNPDA